MRCADRKKMELAGVNSLRHLQRDPRAWHFDATDIAQYPAHLQRRAAGTHHVALGGEPEQQCVAAELEQAATIIVGDLQDRFETAPDRIGDLFRSFAALAREPFRQLRESRDVDEHCAAVTRPEACLRIVDQMLLEDPRDVAARFSDIGLGPLRSRVFRLRHPRRSKHLARHVEEGKLQSLSWPFIYHGAAPESSVASAAHILRCYRRMTPRTAGYARARALITVRILPSHAQVPPRGPAIVLARAALSARARAARRQLWRSVFPTPARASADEVFRSLHAWRRPHR